MIRKVEIQEDGLQVLALQHHSYLVEASLIGAADIPPLNETLEELQACGETFYGFECHGSLVGIISYKLAESVLDIHRLFIHPDYFRQGIARKLVSFLEQTESCNCLIVSTGSGNQPARHLYEAIGFHVSEKRKTADGVSIVDFLKTRGV